MKQTKVIKKNLNPRWGEKFEFSDINIFNNDSNTLHFAVFAHEILSKNHPLGWYEIPLKNLKEWVITEHVLQLKDTAQGKLKIRLNVQRMRDHATQKRLSEEIEKYCKEKNCLFEDPEFPANSFSLFKNGTGQHSDIIVWKRPSEFATKPQLFVDGVEPGDVIQGALGDCYFLGSLSTIATRKDLLKPLIIKYEPKSGLYARTIQFSSSLFLHTFFLPIGLHK